MGLYLPVEFFPKAEVNEELKRRISYHMALEVEALLQGDGQIFDKKLKQEEGKWCVYSEDGSQKLGCHNTKQEAINQLIAIEVNKSKHEDIVAHMNSAMGAKTPEEMREHMQAAMMLMGIAKSEQEPVAKSTFKVTKNEKGEPQWELDFQFQKLDDEERLVGGIVYEPDVIDAQGDSASPAEIRKAAHRFMMESETLGIMHKEEAGPRMRIVETFIVPQTMRIGNQMVRKGTWFMVVKVLDNTLWDGVKKGSYTGFSMSGRARNGEPKE